MQSEEICSHAAKVFTGLGRSDGQQKAKLDCCLVGTIGRIPNIGKTVEKQYLL
ncbi:hypothetical protein EZS27_022039 [termite gut metagenome]|uniref:Uncharacterized protein n=1 Tax=termite gut metagenome TaxID=433724 RepID=A0A5J4R7R7_9ZZZZ